MEDESTNPITGEIVEFSPRKADLQALAESYKNLGIGGIEDKEGYRAVDSARKDLKAQRVAITRTGKELRASALAYQRKIIATEKELIELIEPIEKSLEAKQDAVDRLILLELRKEQLPVRRAELEALGVGMVDETVLEFDAIAWTNFISAKKAEQLAADRLKLEEEQKAFELAKQQASIKEAEEKAAAAKAIEDANAQLKAQAEAHAKELADIAAKAEAEKQAVIIAQQTKELEELRAKEAAEAAKKKAEESEKFQRFLAANGYTEARKEAYLIQGNKLYFLVAEYKPEN